MNSKFVIVTCAAAMSLAMALNGAWAADSSASAAQSAPPVQPAPPNIDPHAEELLTKMCGAVGSADAFSFHAGSLTRCWLAL
jgi:hypothetical protein